MLEELNKLQQHTGNAEAHAALVAKCDALIKDNLSYQDTIAQLRQQLLDARAQQPGQNVGGNAPGVQDQQIQDLKNANQ